MAVFMPQANRKDDMSQLLAMGQVAGGVMSGNPMAAAGGVASLSAQDQAGKTGQVPTVQAAQASPMSRRMTMQQDDPVMTLATAKEALAYQPPEIQKEYGATIDQALKLAQQSRQNTRMA